MLLVVGLGNPGNNYKNTRHNVGFIAVDILSGRYNFSWAHKPKFEADIAVGEYNKYKIILCKPTSYMNLSGVSVKTISSYYKIEPSKVIVIYDDIDIEFGKVKYKMGGSTGGHNGIKSIDNHIGVNYNRIRVGIGRPLSQNVPIAQYVLENFTLQEHHIICRKLEQVVDNIDFLYVGNIEQFKSAISLML